MGWEEWWDGGGCDEHMVMGDQTDAQNCLNCAFRSKETGKCVSGGYEGSHTCTKWKRDVQEFRVETDAGKAPDA